MANPVLDQRLEQGLTDLLQMEVYICLKKLSKQWHNWGGGAMGAIAQSFRNNLPFLKECKYNSSCTEYFSIYANVCVKKSWKNTCPRFNPVKLLLTVFEFKKVH